METGVMKAGIKGKVRLAIIGTGGISRVHADGVLAHGDTIECTALCDINGERLQARSEQFGGVPALYRDWRRMLAKGGDAFDAVAICLPHHLHAPAILDVAAAGKHILCEKPMCLSLAEADRIATAVKRAGITYMSAHNQLFMPAVQEAKRMIEAGELGHIRWLRSQDCFQASVAGFRGTWRSQRKYQGGGELIDTGYHPTYRLLHLAGAPVVGVRGSMGRYLQEIEGEDSASVQVRFANGAIGEILTSWAYGNPYGSHQIHVIGDKAEVFGSGNELNVLPAGYSQPAVRRFRDVPTFTLQMGHFADCLRSGTRPPHSFEEGRAVLAVILAAAEDARGWQKRAAKKS
jgi:predicted dehydrogenase